MTGKVATPLFWGACGLLVGVTFTNLYHAIGAQRRTQARTQPTSATPADTDSALHEPRPQYGLLDILAAPEGQKPLDPDAWVVSAWPPGDGRDPALTVDGSVGTSWQSGERQRPGMFVAADLGKPTPISCVELANSSDNVDDYPRRATVSISRDGILWADIATKKFPQERTPQAGDSAVRLVFSPVATRFVRVSLQADPFAGYRCGGWWWSVGELKLYRPARTPKRVGP